jgi:nicotinate phosphoribosyltransferase
MGTVAHSWVMSFAGEAKAFRLLQRLMGAHTIQLIDTYNTPEGARLAARLGDPIGGVRLDSGDLLSLSREVRGILDEAGLEHAKIVASGDLDEHKIRDLVAGGAPIDSFGVGTQLAISGDAPALSAIYKLVELDVNGIQRFTSKLSEDKESMPGAKQIFRDTARDVVARSGECGKGEALLKPVILGGRLIEPLPTLEQARRRGAESLRQLPAALRQLEPAEPWPVIYSRELRELIEQTRRNLATCAPSL